MAHDTMNRENEPAVIMKEQNGVVFAHDAGNPDGWIQYDGPWMHDPKEMV